MLTETLTWHPVAERMPDDKRTVLLWTREAKPFGVQAWTTGWFDEKGWRLCDSGGVCLQVVTHWAEPNGPEAAHSRRAA